VRDRILVTTMLVGLALPLAAQELPGDPVAGERLARRICAGCHAISRDQVPPDPLIPTFPEAVADPSVRALSLRVFLQTPHATMPSLRLSVEETDDLISYLLTLRRR
jgi:mono/diheme cytochrome c family protein